MARGLQPGICLELRAHNRTDRALGFSVAVLAVAPLGHKDADHYEHLYKEQLSVVSNLKHGTGGLWERIHSLERELAEARAESPEPEPAPTALEKVQFSGTVLEYVEKFSKKGDTT